MWPVYDWRFYGFNPIFYESIPMAIEIQVINNPAANYLATRSGVLNYPFKRLRSKLRGIEAASCGELNPKRLNVRHIHNVAKA